MNRLLSALLSSAVLAGSLSAQDSAQYIAPDSVALRELVDVRTEDSTIVVEARYATTTNFTGAVLPGYEANKAFLRREAAEALHRVQQRLRSGGMGLKIFDGYRPVRATQAMVEMGSTHWADAPDPGRLHRKPEPTQPRPGGGSDSGGFLGAGVRVDMGTPFDTFRRNPTGPTPAAPLHYTAVAASGDGGGGIQAVRSGMVALHLRGAGSSGVRYGSQMSEKD